MRKKTKVERRKGSWVSVPYTKGDYLKEYLPYGILIAFLVSSYFMFTNVGGTPEETIKLCATYFVLTFIFALILLAILYIVYIVALLVGVAYYGIMVFLTIVCLIIIYQMVFAGHTGAAFGWPVAAGGALGVLILLFLIAILIGLIIVGPLILPLGTAGYAFEAVGDVIGIFAIFMYLLYIFLVFNALNTLTKDYSGEEDVDLWSPPYLSFLGGFYSSLLIANFVYTVAVVKDVLKDILSLDILETISSSGLNLLSFEIFNLSLPVFCSSILFGLLFSSIFCRVVFR